MRSPYQRKSKSGSREVGQNAKMKKNGMQSNPDWDEDDAALSINAAFERVHIALE
jgi:hypothetical protein